MRYGNSHDVSEFSRLDAVLQMFRQSKMWHSGFDEEHCMDRLRKPVSTRIWVPVLSLIGAPSYGFGTQLEMEKTLQEIALYRFNLAKLQTDAIFLRTLSLLVPYWSNKNLAQKIRCLVSQVAHDLASAPETFKDRLIAVQNSQAKICDLMLEFGKCVVVIEPELFVLGSLLQHWSELVESTQEGLMNLKMRFCVNDGDIVLAPLMDSFHTILSLFLDFLTSIGEPFLLSHPGFMAHAISVVTCVANRCCCCWFLATDTVTAKGEIIAILDLKDEIDLTDRQFFMLCLYSFQATDGLVPILEPELSRLSHLFLSYLLKSAYTTNGLFEELLPLVSIVIKNEAGFPDNRLLEEIKDMLLGVAFLYQPLSLGRAPDASLCSEFLVTACFLKAEILLKELLHDGSRFSMSRLNAVVDKLKRISTTLENKERALEFVEVVARDIQSLYAYLVAENTAKFSVRNSVLVILLRIVSFKAESFFLNLRDNSSLEDQQIMNFHEGLDLFISIVTNLQFELSDNVTSILEDAEDVFRSITSFSYSYLADKKREEVVTNMKELLPDYLRKMNFILSGLSPIFPDFIVPKINELRLVDLLLVNLRYLPTHDPCSLSTVRHFVEDIQATLQSWRPFLTTALNSEAAENLGLDSLSKQAILVVYKLAYVIDLIEIHGLWQHAWWLYNIIQEMRLIDGQVPANQEISQSCHKVQNVSRAFPCMNKNTAEMVVANRGGQEGDIINELKRGSRQQYIISIVGMPGIGKTTLAKKLFIDPNVVAHFNRFAWCSISQTHGKKDLLLEILKDTDGLGDSDDLEVKLYRLLKQHRYLIVLDDLWDVEAMNSLADAFQENGNGSKILITTRDHKVASDATPKGGDPYFLHPLTEEESWDLLKMKLFSTEGPEGSCPDEVVEVGKEIAQACKGLPLSIVAVAGILGRREKTVESWRKIAKNLNKQIVDDPQTQCNDILELSYMCLPPHLRECFLYLGAFLEYRDVSSSKLVRLWIAEGFIEKNGPKKSLEDTAEGYLMDLIDRSLVMISGKRSNGTVKSCSVHDLLREFCHMKAKAGNLFQQITKQDEPYASFDGVEYGNEFYNYCLSIPVTYESYRVCVKLNKKHFADSRPSGPWTRSLMLLPSIDADPSCHYDISLIPKRFRLLTVLNLECINISNGFPSDIEVLVHLRYLAVSGNVNSIPRSIENLWRLITLIVRASSDEIVLPSNIWCLAKLRHLHVKSCATFNMEDNMTENDSSRLHDLVTFSSPALSSATENIIRRLPNLRKLSCIYCKSKGTGQFPELQSLTCLESLRIIYSGTALTSSKFSLPESLKKLTLSKFALPWNQIDDIARLPNLEVLKLVCGAYDGALWDMEGIEFPVLKFLMLDSLNIAQWASSSNNFPLLEKLVVKNCKELEEVPYDFSGIDTLASIEVQCCKKSVEQSVRNIKEAYEAVSVIISSSYTLKS